MATSNSVAISIVIPVYNGSAFIEATIQSLLAQTFTNFEVICVNDSSTDNSLALLESLASKDDRIKIYTKPNEGTAAKAVVHGLKFVTGDYFMYSSQDDFFSVDLLEKNFNQAKATGADAVVPDLVFYSQANNNNPGLAGVNGNRDIVLTGREAFVLSLDWTIHGFVMWDMNVVRKTGYYDYGLNSDEFTTRMLYFNANKVVFSTGVFYYSQNNPQSITKKWNIRLLESFDTCNRLDDFLVKHHFSKQDFWRSYTRTLAELLRIESIFLLNKKSIHKEEATRIQHAIKKVYQQNRKNIASMPPKNFMTGIRYKILTAGFGMFRLYCSAGISYRKMKGTT